VRLLILVLIVLTAGAAHAAPPATISYQGVLRDDGGSPVPDGTYSVEFAIYDVETGGTALWLDHGLCTVTDGMLNAIIGSDGSLDLSFDEPYWLGIAVEGEAELTPRIELTSSPYAFRAGVADSLAGGVPADTDWTESGGNVYRAGGNVGIGTATPAFPLDVQGSARFTWGLLSYEVETGTVNSDYVNAMSVYANNSLTLESGAANGYVLTSDAYGEGTWQPVPGVTPPGSSGDVIFNDAGTLGAATGLHYDSINSRLGIGTSSPGFPLDVQGSARFNGGLLSYEVETGTVNSDFVNALSVYANNSLTLESGAANGYVLTSDAYGEGTWQPVPGVTPPGSSGEMLYNDGGALGAAPALHYDSANGRLGVGTSSPDEELTVAGDAHVTGGVAADILSTGSLTSSGITVGTIRVNSSFRFPGGAADGYILTSDASGVGTWQPPASSVGGSGATGFLPKFTGSTTLGNSIVYEDATGVGIGTASPAHALDVAGDAGVSADLRVGGQIVSDVASPTAPLTVSSAAVCPSLNADMVDGHDAGNDSGDVALNNGTVCTNLNADKVDGHDAGNDSGDVALSNSIVCSNLNADVLHGYRPGNDSGYLAVNNGVLNEGLNADQLHGRRPGNFSGDVAVSNGTVCTNLNAEMVGGVSLGSFGHRGFGQHTVHRHPALHDVDARAGLRPSGRRRGLHGDRLRERHANRCDLHGVQRRRDEHDERSRGNRDLDDHARDVRFRRGRLQGDLPGRGLR